jgi:3-oxoacyl-[acyl-carrier protein] reductase
MSFSLEGKTAVVTGAGRGIGRAIATTLADAGASAMLNDLEPGPLSETCDALTSAGHRVCTFAGDLTKPPFRAREGNARSIRRDRHHREQRRLFLGQCRAKDDRRTVPSDARHSSVVPFRMARAASEYIRAQAKREIAEGRRVMRKIVNITSISGTDGDYVSGEVLICGGYHF